MAGDNKRGNFLSDTKFNIRTSDILAQDLGDMARIETDGFLTAGDGGRAEWRATGGSSTPGTTDFPNSRLYDAAGNEFLLDESYLDPLMFGVVGDGTTDDSAAMQEALDAVANTGWVLRLPRQRTFVVKLLKIDASGSRPFEIEGNGARFLAPATIGLNEPIIENLTTGTYVDTDISIQDMVFDGNNQTAGSKRTSSLVRLARVVGVKFSNVRVTNTQYIGLSTNGSRVVDITGCRFDNCGWQTTSTNGGAALWIAQSGGGGTDGPQDIRVRGCEFKDNNWHGIQLSAERAEVDGCVFTDNQEAALFISDAADAPCKNITISNNSIDGVIENDSAAVGMELGGVSGFTVVGNSIRNTEAAGVAISSSFNGTISGNAIGNNGIVATESFGILLNCSGSGNEALRNISITGNTFYDDNLTPITDGGITISGIGDDAENVTIDANTFDAALIGSSGVFKIVGRWAPADDCHVGYNPGLSSTAVTLASATTLNLKDLPLNLVAQTIVVSGTTRVDFMSNGINGQKITLIWDVAATFDIFGQQGGAGQFHFRIASHVDQVEGSTLTVINWNGEWYQATQANINL